MVLKAAWDMDLHLMSPSLSLHVCLLSVSSGARVWPVLYPASEIQFDQQSASSLPP